MANNAEIRAIAQKFMLTTMALAAYRVLVSPELVSTIFSNLFRSPTDFIYYFCTSLGQVLALLFLAFVSGKAHYVWVLLGCMVAGTLNYELQFFATLVVDPPSATSEMTGVILQKVIPIVLTCYQGWLVISAFRVISSSY
jgi:hypothetical protein